MNSKDLAWLIRRHGIEMTHVSRGSHIGSILSVADIIAVLYSDIMVFNNSLPKMKTRDRLILSKGHAGASIYAALAECGFFNVEELLTHYSNGSRLSGHVSHYVPGVDFSTGSLGHGLSAGVGMAYALKKNKNNSNIFTIMGDGECNEGSVWEAAMVANEFNLDNLIAIVDKNKMQSLDFSENTMKNDSTAQKWASFGWNVIEINGNDHYELKAAFSDAKKIKRMPTVIIANTIKGYGVKYMENDILWHYRFPHEGWEYDMAINYLHEIKPKNVIDPYTLNGIENPKVPSSADNIYKDNTLSATWRPTQGMYEKKVEFQGGNK